MSLSRTPRPHCAEPLKSHDSRPAASPSPSHKTSQLHCVDIPKSPQSHHPKTLARQCHTTAPEAWDPSEGQADPLLSQKLQPGQNAGPEPSRSWDSHVPKKSRFRFQTPKTSPGPSSIQAARSGRNTQPESVLPKWNIPLGLLQLEAAPGIFTGNIPFSSFRGELNLSPAHFFLF